jgi:hypothetical protein
MKTAYICDKSARIARRARALLNRAARRSTDAGARPLRGLLTAAGLGLAVFVALGGNTPAAHAAPSATTTTILDDISNAGWIGTSDPAGNDPEIIPGTGIIFDTITSGVDTSILAGNFQLIPAASGGTLDTTTGYVLTFNLKLDAETHDGINGANRAGFSLTAIGADMTKSVELGFWTDKIQAQSLNSSKTEFSFAEGATFDTTAEQNYSLFAKGNLYVLYDGAGNKIFGGALRDYAGYVTSMDPYSVTNTVYLGDNTSSAVAQATVKSVGYGTLSSLGQVLADGTTEAPSSGVYETTFSGGSSTNVSATWLAKNNGTINATGSDAGSIIVSSGAYNHGIRAEGEGSIINAQDVSISTDGSTAYGVSMTNGGAVNLSGNTTIVTSGNSGVGIGNINTDATYTGDLAVGTTANPVAGSIITKGSSAHGIYISNAGTGANSIVNHASIVASGSSSGGIQISATNTPAGSSITNTGDVTSASTGLTISSRVASSSFTATKTVSATNQAASVINSGQINSRNMGINSGLFGVQINNSNTASNITLNWDQTHNSIKNTGDITSASFGVIAFVNSMTVNSTSVRTQSGNITINTTDAYSEVENTGNITVTGEAATGINANIKSLELSGTGTNTLSGNVTITVTGEVRIQHEEGIITTLGSESHAISGLIVSTNRYINANHRITGTLTEDVSGDILIGVASDKISARAITGEIHTYGVGSNGINARHYGSSGNIVINNAAAITTTGIGSHGIYVDNSGSGDITINNTGDITLDGSTGGSAIYVVASSMSYPGTINVVNSGNLDTSNAAYWSIQLRANRGSMSLVNTGDIQSASSNIIATTNLQSRTGTFTDPINEVETNTRYVENSGSLVGGGNYAIFNGYVNSYFTGATASAVVNSNLTQDLTVKNAGGIETTKRGIMAFSVGMSASGTNTFSSSVTVSQATNVVVENTANISTTSISGAGIMAYGYAASLSGNSTFTGGLSATAANTIRITHNTGTISTQGNENYGIYAALKGISISAGTTLSGTISSDVSGKILIGYADNAGSIMKPVSGSITTEGLGASGISAMGEGAVEIKIVNTATITTAGAGAVGIDAALLKSILSGTSNFSEINIASGDIAITHSGKIHTTGGFAWENTSKTSITADRDITPGSAMWNTTAVRGADGIRVTSQGSGNITLGSADAPIAGEIKTEGNGSAGIRVSSQGGDVSVYNGANIIATRLSGRYVTTAGNGYNVGDFVTDSTVTLAGSTSVSTAGISVSNSGQAVGNLTIVNSGDITISGGSNSHGISGSSAGGSVNSAVSVTNTGDITVNVADGDQSALGLLASGYGDVTVTNSGNITTGVNASGNIRSANSTVSIATSDINVDGSGTTYGYGSTVSFTHDDGGAGTTLEMFGSRLRQTADPGKTYSERPSVIKATSGGQGTANIDIQILNIGRIVSHGDDAHGIYAFNKGTNDIMTYGSSAGSININVADATAKIITEGNASHGIFVENRGRTVANMGDNTTATAFVAQNSAITITNAASITTGIEADTTKGAGSYGIYVENQGTGNVALTNSGTIFTDGAAAHAIQIVTKGTGSTVITNESTGTIRTANGRGLNVTLSGSGTASITNHADIVTGMLADGVTATGTGGTGIVISRSSVSGQLGTITALNSGNITAYGSSAGTFSVNGGQNDGDVSVTNHGVLTQYVNESDATPKGVNGLSVNSGGNAFLTNAGSVYSGKNSGNVSVESHSAIYVYSSGYNSGNYDAGTVARLIQDGANSVIESYGDRLFDGAMPAAITVFTATGGQGTSDVDIQILHAKEINTYGDGVVGVKGWNTGTNKATTLTTLGTETFAEAGGDITINVADATAKITTLGHTAYGILADNSGRTVANMGQTAVSGYATPYVAGDGDITVTNAATISTSVAGDIVKGAGSHAIYVNNSGKGQVEINNTGALTTYGPGAYGIYAAMASTGDTYITNSGDITTHITGTVANVSSSDHGIHVRYSTAAATGNTYIGVKSDGTVTPVTGTITTNKDGDANAGGCGMAAQSGGTGNVSIYSAATINTTNSSTAYGIFAQINNTNATSDAFIGNAGDITTGGANSYGLYVQNTGRGASTVLNSGNITTAGSSAHGVYVVSNVAGVADATDYSGSIVAGTTNTIITSGTSAVGIYISGAGSRYVNTAENLVIHTGAVLDVDGNVVAGEYSGATSALGIRVQNSAELTLANVSVTTHGDDYKEDGNVGSMGVTVTGGATVNLDQAMIEAQGMRSSALSISGANSTSAPTAFSEVNLTNSSIKTTGHRGSVMVARNGGQINLTDVDISSTGLHGFAYEISNVESGFTAALATSVVTHVGGTVDVGESDLVRTDTEKNTTLDAQLTLKDVTITASGVNAVRMTNRLDNTTVELSMVLDNTRVTGDVVTGTDQEYDDGTTGFVDNYVIDETQWSYSADVNKSTFNLTLANGAEFDLQRQAADAYTYNHKTVVDATSTLKLSLGVPQTFAISDPAALAIGAEAAADMATDFTGTLALGNGTFTLAAGNDNVTALTSAKQLKIQEGSVTVVSGDVNVLNSTDGTVTLDGGTLRFNSKVPGQDPSADFLTAAKLDIASGAVQVDIGSSDGSSFDPTSLDGTPLFDLQNAWDYVQIASGETALGSATELQDHDGNVITPSSSGTRIEQAGDVVATATYGYTLASSTVDAPTVHDGLYVGFALQGLHILEDKTLTIDNDGAVNNVWETLVTGDANSTLKLVDSSGAGIVLNGTGSDVTTTDIAEGTISLGIDGGLGTTENLIIRDGATLDMNGKASEAGNLVVERGADLALNDGELEITDDALIGADLTFDGTGTLIVGGTTTFDAGTTTGDNVIISVTDGSSLQLNDVNVGNNDLDNGGAIIYVHDDTPLYFGGSTTVNKDGAIIGVPQTGVNPGDKGGDVTIIGDGPTIVDGGQIIGGDGADNSTGPGGAGGAVTLPGPITVINDGEVTGGNGGNGTTGGSGGSVTTDGGDGDNEINTGGKISGGDGGDGTDGAGGNGGDVDLGGSGNTTVDGDGEIKAGDGGDGTTDGGNGGGVHIGGDTEVGDGDLGNGTGTIEGGTGGNGGTGNGGNGGDIEIDGGATVNPDGGLKGGDGGNGGSQGGNGGAGGDINIGGDTEITGPYDPNSGTGGIDGGNGGNGGDNGNGAGGNGGNGGNTDIGGDVKVDEGGQINNGDGGNGGNGTTDGGNGGDGGSTNIDGNTEVGPGSEINNGDGGNGGDGQDGSGGTGGAGGNTTIGGDTEIKGGDGAGNSGGSINNGDGGDGGNGGTSGGDGGAGGNTEIDGNTHVDGGTNGGSGGEISGGTGGNGGDGQDGNGGRGGDGGDVNIEGDTHVGGGDGDDNGGRIDGGKGGDGGNGGGENGKGGDGGDGGSINIDGSVDIEEGGSLNGGDGGNGGTGPGGEGHGGQGGSGGDINIDGEVSGGGGSINPGKGGQDGDGTGKGLDGVVVISDKGTIYVRDPGPDNNAQQTVLIIGGDKYDRNDRDYAGGTVVNDGLIKFWDKDAAGSADQANYAGRTSDTAATAIIAGDYYGGQAVRDGAGKIVRDDNGKVQLVDGTSGDLYLNAWQLYGTDNSVVDQLVINGGAYGQTNVTIVKHAGTGAKTEGEGILVITVKGDSAADAFNLVNPLYAGFYTYNLQHGLADNNWYLRSIGINPAGGSILTGAAASSIAWFAGNDNLLKRMGDLRLMDTPANSGSAWVRAYGQQNNISLGDGIPDSRVYSYGADTGGDIVFDVDGGRVATGAFIGYVGNSNRLQDGSGAKTKMNGIQMGVYATYMVESGFYADLVSKAQYADNEIRGADHGDYNSYGAGVSLELGWQFESLKGWFVEPSAQVAYMHQFNDTYSTANGLHVQMQDADICQFSGMVRFGRTVNVGESLVQPYAKVGVLQQATSGGHLRSVDSRWRPTVDGTNAVFGVGVNFQVTPATQIHFDYEGSFSEKNEKPWAINLGVTTRF